jgi:spore coat polysaccharide biosynthesis predicted glycosyltransferase SpsG
MAKADLALSSAGRTITELAQIGIPTICLAQNHKELSHTHATEANGVVNLGLGVEVTPENLTNAILQLMPHQRRQALSENQLTAVALRTNAKVANKIISLA